MAAARPLSTALGTTNMLLRTLAACAIALLLARQSAHAQTLSDFEMKGVVLYQADQILESRLGEGATGLAEYVKKVVSTASVEFGKQRGRGASGAIVVAVKPGGASRMWLVLGDNELPQGLPQRLKSSIEGIAALPVYIGPVAFAITFDAWGGGKAVTTAEDPAPIPDEWRAANSGPGPVVVPDGVLDVIWP